MIRRRLFATVFAMFLANASHAQAQSYPVKPVLVILNSAPGAGADFTGRVLAERLGQRLGTTFVVDNRAGASGVIGAQAVKRAAPDGYTLLYAADTLVLNMAIGGNKEVNPSTDLTPVALFTTIDFFLVVSGEALAAQSPLDFVRIARERKGALSYATPGIGTPHHLGMELLKERTGIDVLHVPFKGTGAAMPDLLAGRLQALVTGFPAVASHMKSGKLRILAVAGPARSQERPDVPTLAEAGIPNVEIQGYNYLMAPLNTPGPIVQRLNREANEILKDAQVRNELVKRGANPAGGTPEELDRKLRTELEKWSVVAKRAGIKPE